MNGQSIERSLDLFWRQHGCRMLESATVRPGRALFAPEMFFAALSVAPCSVALLQECADPGAASLPGSPMSLALHTQFQALLKPAPENGRRLVLAALKAAGLDPRLHDARWSSRNLSLPQIGATGFGWQLRLDGIAVAVVFHLLSLAGNGLPQGPAFSVTMGLERMKLLSGAVSDIRRAAFGDDYLAVARERQFGQALLAGDRASLLAAFADNERQCAALAGRGLYFPAAELLSQCLSLYDCIRSRRPGISPVARRALCSRCAALARICSDQYRQAARQNTPLTEPPLADSIA